MKAKESKYLRVKTVSPPPEKLQAAEEDESVVVARAAEEVKKKRLHELRLNKAIADAN